MARLRAGYREVRVGNTVCPVELGELKGLHGKMEPFPRHRIVINRKIHQDILGKTIFHEALHVISEVYGFDWEEQQVLILENAIPALFRDNPQLAKDVL